MRWRRAAWWTLPIGLAVIRFTGDVSGFVLIFAAALIAAATLGSRHPVPAVLSVPPLRWIGRVSYVVYVVHFPIAARLLGDGVSPLVNLAVTLALSLLIAAASWRWFEQPILAVRTRWPMPSGEPAAAGVGGDITVASVGTSSAGRREALLQTPGSAP